MPDTTDNDIEALIEFLATASKERFYYTATHNAEKYHRALTALVAERDALSSEVGGLRSAMKAQDDRERDAGERCGVSRNLSGCDWPDAVADEVIALKQRVAELKRDVDMWREDAHKWKEMYNRHYESERIWISRCDELKQRVAELEAREAELLDSNAELHRRLNRIMASPVPFPPADRDLRKDLICAALSGASSQGGWRSPDAMAAEVVKIADATIAAMREGESHGK